MNNSNPDEAWILDTACTFHMTHRDLFSTYEEVSKDVVITGNNTPCWIAGIDWVIIRMFGGTIRALEAVRLVPDLKKNLISLSTLDSEGYNYTVKGGATRPAIFKKGWRE